MSDDLLLAKEDGIATITLNRPDQRNAMNYGMWQGIGRLCAELEKDPAVRVVIVTGAGQEAFSAGADIKEFGEYRDNSTKAHRWARVVEVALEGLAGLSKPTIALVKGYCIGGGCELAAFADLRVAAENAQFGITAARLGIVLGYKEMRRLVQLVGPGSASYILLSAKLLDAQEALRIGLVNQVVPLETVDDYTARLANGIAELAPLAHSGNKEIIHTVLANPGLLDITPEQEALPFKVFDSEDYREGRRAFVEKRRPQFQGR